jgi:hypothetical protein
MVHHDVVHRRVLKKKDVFQKPRVQQFRHVVHQVVVCHDVLTRKDALQGMECRVFQTAD